jgi:outer membrane usher protein
MRGAGVDRRWTIKGRQLTWALLGLSLLFARVSSADAGVGQRAMLELVVNEASRGETVVVMRGHEIWLLVRAVEDAGLTSVDGRRETIDREEYVLVSSLAPAIRFTFDERNLTLRLTADAARFARTTLAVDDPRPADLVFRHAPSAFINYGVTWQPSSEPDAFVEAALSLGTASLSSTFSRLGVAPPRRGVTTLTIDRRDQMQRWSVGDITVTPGAFDAGGIIAGISVAREYGLDPYFRRTPSPTLTGTAVTPSTVDVYVNDRLERSEQVPPGPFDVTRVPFTSGLGTTTVVVRDVFGREQEFGRMFYLPSSLLARGNREYRYAIGARRSVDVTQPASYGRWAAFASDRRGLASWVTAGFRVELDGVSLDGGPVFSVQLWHLGEIDGGFSGSHRGEQRGGAGYLTYTFTSGSVSLALAARSVTSGYASIAEVASGRAASQVSAAVSLPAVARVSLSLEYARTTAADAQPATRRMDQRSSVTGSWRALGRLSTHVTAVASQHAGRWQFNGFVGATVLLGPRLVASLAHERDAGSATTVVEAQQSPPVGTGLGYRFRAARGADDAFHGELTYRGPFGEYRVVRDAGSSSSGASWTSGTSVGVSGGMVLIGGQVHATRAVSASYALVRIPEAAGVRVYADNQEVGRTNTRGNLLVPNLLEYHGNRLGIADTDLPLDYDIKTTSENVAPPYRGGAVVLFAGQHIQAISGRITVRHAGVDLVPAFGALVLTVGQEPHISPIGEHGEFYFENLPAGSYPALVQFETGTCTFTVSVPVTTAPLVLLGTLTCNAKSSQEVDP